MKMCFTQETKVNCKPESLIKLSAADTFKIYGSDLWYWGCKGCYKHCCLGACLTTKDNQYRPTIGGKLIKTYIDEKQEEHCAGRFYTRKEALDMAEKAARLCDFYVCQNYGHAK